MSLIPRGGSSFVSPTSVPLAVRGDAAASTMSLRKTTVVPPPLVEPVEVGTIRLEMVGRLFVGEGVSAFRLSKNGRPELMLTDGAPVLSRADLTSLIRAMDMYEDMYDQGIPDTKIFEGN